MHITWPALSDGTIDGVVCTVKYTSDTVDDAFSCYDSTQTSNSVAPTKDPIQNVETNLAKMVKEYYTDSGVAYATLGAHFMRRYDTGDTEDFQL